jgi:hypothetical protein
MKPPTPPFAAVEAAEQALELRAWGSSASVKKRLPGGGLRGMVGTSPETRTIAGGGEAKILGFDGPGRGGGEQT